MTDEDTDGIDYRSITVPDDKSPEDYTYAERRAEILRRIEDVGHPGRVNGAELARRYDCTPQNIYNDFDVLAEYVEDTVGDRADLTIDSVFNKAIRGLLEQKEYRKAAKTASEYGEWITEQHELSEMWERLEEIEGQHDQS
jgi:hypothetical protein